MAHLHEAIGPLTGYLYQVLIALLSLLESTDNDAQICIEKFDDVAFIEEDEPIIMIQTKHHLKQQSNLSDTSSDLWRTINSWCDAIKQSPTGLSKTNFVIITTAMVNEKTAAFFLSNKNNRDTKKVLEILINIASTSQNKANINFYRNFIGMSPDLQYQLVDNIHIYSNSPNIDELKSSLMRFVRCATIQQYEEKLYIKLIGWWIIEIIKCLLSPDLVFINRKQIQNILHDYASEYQADSLPIDIDFTYNPTDKELEQLNQNKRIFIEQLKLILLSDDRIKRCIRDYYNAFRQRSLWVREQLLLVNELSNYETLLVDEWYRLFLIMSDDLTGDSSPSNDKQKINAGRKLFNDIEKLNINIRDRVEKPFIMRGTYHDLANKLKVGWHIDFIDRLCHLLKE